MQERPEGSEMSYRKGALPYDFNVWDFPRVPGTLLWLLDSSPHSIPR